MIVLEENCINALKHIYMYTLDTSLNKITNSLISTVKSKSPYQLLNIIKYVLLPIKDPHYKNMLFFMIHKI